jgi:hypothetical protein
VQVAETVNDVHRHDLFAEAVLIMGAAKMQLPDGYYPVLLIDEAMPPPGHMPMIGLSIGPAIDFMNVSAGLKRPACWNAKRTIGIGISEYDTVFGYSVHMGRFDYLIAGASQDPFRMFIGHYHQHVCILHNSPFPALEQFSSSPRSGRQSLE